MNDCAIWQFTNSKALKIKELTIRRNLIGRLISGQKHLSHDVSQPITLTADTLFLLPNHSVWEVVNDPKPHQQYSSQVIELNDSIMELFYQYCCGQQPNSKIVQSYAQIPMDKSLIEAFTRIEECFAYPHSVSGRITQHRLLELLLLLSERGYAFALPQHITTSDKIRHIVGHKLHHVWPRATIAKAMNISESTLQRQLSAESMTYTKLLKLIRMEYALFLIMEKRHSVATIAARCGYHSHSRFTEVFSRHYGKTPSQLINSKTQETIKAKN